jgi:hypothetical protein
MIRHCAIRVDSWQLFGLTIGRRNGVDQRAAS